MPLFQCVGDLHSTAEKMVLSNALINQVGEDGAGE